MNLPDDVLLRGKTDVYLKYIGRYTAGGHPYALFIDRENTPLSVTTYDEFKVNMCYAASISLTCDSSMSDAGDYVVDYNEISLIEKMKGMALQPLQWEKCQRVAAKIHDDKVVGVKIDFT